MMSTATFFTTLGAVVAFAVLAVYLFGIPPEIKRKLERSALKTMGENKLSYVAKGKIAFLTIINASNSPHL